MNHRQDLWQVALTARPEAEELAQALLEKHFHGSATAYHDFERGRTVVSVYLDRAPVNWPETRRVLQAELRSAIRDGIPIGSFSLTCRRLRAATWIDSWKRHCRAFTVGGRLMIRPSWSRKPAAPGVQVLTIDPGLSFGTGHHATTRFCLEQVVKHRPSATPRSLLDIGTGTAILAMAAARLGYRPVDAFDCDPEAVRVATENLAQNGLTNEVELDCRDLTGAGPWLARGYNVICANILANILVAEAPRILRSLLPGGILLLAGILRNECAEVEAAYKRLGCKPLDAKSQGEWRSLSVQRPA